MKKYDASVTALATATLALISTVNAQDGAPFSGCNASEYYSDLLSTGSPETWEISALASLVNSTQRYVLPNAGGSNIPDIFTALIALFPGDDPGNTVHLAFRDISFPAVPYASTTTWTRLDIWPISRGASRESAALTDIHSKMCGDSTVIAEWGDLFFGECGTVQDESYCYSPDETDGNSFSDRKIWTPPDNVKGDIARALFYNVIRYGEELGLQLTDCPPFTDTQFGYLSPLLQWHESDPVSEEEMLRNDEACRDWQGNRNPMIDYPELVQQYFGTPDEIMAGTHSYSRCVVATQAPTATPNPCSDLEAGDIQVILMNSPDPTELAFFTLDLIPNAVGSLYLTVDAWDGSKFMGTGGTISIKVPNETIGSDLYPCPGWCPGMFYTYGFLSDQGNWTEVDDIPFAVNASGDTLLTYCLDSDGLPNFLNGFTFAEGGWAETGLTSYSPSQSALPDDLAEVGSVAVPYFQNYYYNGTTQATKNDLATMYFNNPDNYVGSDEERQTIPGLNSSGPRILSANVLLLGLVGLCSSLLMQ